MMMARPTAAPLFPPLTPADDPAAAPRGVMAEAALQLCSAEPHALTGRITYSQDLLAELNVPQPAGR